MTNEKNRLTCRGKLFHESDYLVMAPQQIRRISAWYKERVKITGKHIANRFFYFDLDAGCFSFNGSFFDP